MVSTAWNVELRALAVPALCLAGWAAAPGVSAQSLPEGLVVGPWILAPSLTTSYEYDDNVFYETSGAAQDDSVTSYRGDLRAVLPFRNSRLQIDYGASKEHYDTIEFDRDVSQVGTVDLRMNFRTGDELRVRDIYRRDYARADIPELTGETELFRGEPFTSNQWEVELARTDPRRQGYVIRVRRQDFTYDERTDLDFLEYRGFDNIFEYRQPLPRDRSWIVRYEARRFNYYRPDDPVGSLLRDETTDALYLGLRGFMGREDQPYRIHLGYARFRYRGDEPSDYNGFVGAAAWLVRLGGNARLDLEAIRRALPSNFETHYINNVVHAQFTREWRRFEAGSQLELTYNDYAGEIEDLGCSGARRDSIGDLDVFGAWRAYDRLRFRVASFHNRRSSSCDDADYAATGVETGLSVGWF